MKAQDLINAAEEVLAIMHGEEKGLLEASSTGGYMTVLSPRDRYTTPLLVAQVGELTDPEKIEKYHRLSREKAGRLLVNALRGHHSSWDSRNPDEDKWGGAILAGDLILSFSGLTELADEALMFTVAVKLELLTRKQVRQISFTNFDKFFDLLIKN